MERLRAAPWWLRGALAAVAAALTAAAALAWLPAPFVWIGFAWFGIGTAAAWLSPSSGLPWFYLGIAFLVLGLLEANAHRKPSMRFDRGYDESYTAADPDLGYAPAAPGPVHTTKYIGDQPIYEVTYTLDDDLLRVAPPASGPDAACVLFFGGSFTYGEGVGDHETLPWRVGERTGARVYNFGFHGYGPHQMLAAIESGRVERTVACRPTVAIYQAIIDHVNRAVGIAHWDRHGPRYMLDASGRAVRNGNFDDDRSALERLLWAVGQKSLIVKRVSQRRRAVTAADVALFHAIVDEARRALQQRFPGIAFHAILWDQSGAPDASFWRGLEERGIPVHLMSRIMPQRVEGDPRFVVGPLDDHPNAAVYDAIADYVVRHILPAPGP